MNILIFHGHTPSEYSQGHLNQSFVEIAEETLASNGHNLRKYNTTADYDIDAVIADHQWADAIIIQTPVHSMSLPWSIKKFMDEVYTFGMDGRLSKGDGRSSKAPKENYGMGGTLHGKNYIFISQR
ncbi:UNVERIFIED_CONTAM: hypothetical protein GTU68_000667 [Idotea baltica]|nr:hypothetical protein [Idotea baltica]